MEITPEEIARAAAEESARRAGRPTDSRASTVPEAVGAEAAKGVKGTAGYDLEQAVRAAAEQSKPDVLGRPGTVSRETQIDLALVRRRLNRAANKAKSIT